MIPLKMHMVNFGPYADSAVDFNFKSALVVGENSSVSGASNGTGKSTIFQALTWVLTGSSRYKNSNSIIRDGTDAAKVTLLFKVGEEHYQIIRGRNRTNKQTLDFNKVLPDGKLEPVKADTNSKLDEKIAEVTRVRYDSFVNTAYFAQNTISEFMYGTSSVRQKLIAEILSMDRWNSYAKNAATHLADTERELEMARYKASVFGNLAEQKKKAAADRETAEVTAASLLQKIAELESAEEAVRTAAASEAGRVQAAATRSALQQLLASAQRGAADARKASTDADAHVQRIDADILSLASAVVEPGARPDVSAAIAQRLAERRGDLAVIQRRVAAMEAGKCDTCGSSWGHDHSSEIESLRAQANDLRNRISVGEGKLAEARAAELAWDQANSKYMTAINRRDSLVRELESASAAARSAANRIAAAEAELRSAEGKLASAPEPPVGASDAIDKLKKIQADLSASRQKHSTCMASLGQLSAKADLLQQQETEFSVLAVRTVELEKEVNLYTALSKHFSKTGIQASILDTVVSEIETLSNTFLRRLSHKPFSIRFITQKQDTKGQMKETLDVEVMSPGSIKYIEDLSGGEQFRVAFSVRLALAAVQARRQGGELTLLLLDEVSSSLDKVGIETFVSIVKELQKTMIVMLITHDDSLKEHFDNVIKVSSDGQVAKIIQ
jgi:DNA repair exonuclease SbcCD ATPase subunit